MQEKYIIIKYFEKLDNERENMEEKNQKIDYNRGRTV